MNCSEFVTDPKLIAAIHRAASYCGITYDAALEAYCLFYRGVRDAMVSDEAPRIVVYKLGNFDLSTKLVKRKLASIREHLCRVAADSPEAGSAVRDYQHYERLMARIEAFKVKGVCKTPGYVSRKMQHNG